MTVDQLCKTAGVTKGAFSHHFEDKAALGIAAAVYWSETTSAFFAQAPYHRHDDPLDWLIGYVEFRKDIIEGDLAKFTCLVGTMTQEIYDSHPAIGRSRATASITIAATSKCCSPRRPTADPWEERHRLVCPSET